MTPRSILEGIKIADFTWVAVGPLVTRQLAEHGATVVHIESHKRPDYTRVSAPYKDGIPGIDRSGMFAIYHTNKYGMSLDLTKPQGREVARKLVAWADVVAEGMSPGSMAKLGLDYESCRQIKPDIIYVSTSQMGQTGPHRNLGGYGPMGAAYSGVLHVVGWPDRPPVRVTVAHSDYIAPWYLCTVIVAALDHRRRTGKGLYLDQAQIESGIAFWGPGLLDYIANGRIVVRMGNRDPYMAPHGAFPCLGDDEWAAVAIASDKEWRALVLAMGDPGWAREPRFVTLLVRKENEDELEHLVAEWTKDYTAEQVMATLQAVGVPSV